MLSNLSTMRTMPSGGLQVDQPDTMTHYSPVHNLAATTNTLCNTAELYGSARTTARAPASSQLNGQTVASTLLPQTLATLPEFSALSSQPGEHLTNPR